MEIDRLNKTYLGKVKFNPNFIDCNSPKGLHRDDPASSIVPVYHYLEQSKLQKIYKQFAIKEEL